MTILVKITDLDLSAKVVLIREDYNVPMQAGKIIDDTRVHATLPTIREVLDQQAKIILVSHLGRPTAGTYDPQFSLQPVAELLSELLNMEVPLITHWTDGISLAEYQVVLCENVRFEVGEVDNDDGLSRKLAQLCDVYINDAFATSHRTHATTYGVAKYANVAAAGTLLINELKALTRITRDAQKPLVAIVGGAKISTKLGLLKSLCQQVDQLIVGGGIANTFLKALGYEIGCSLCEDSLVEEAKDIFDLAKTHGCEIPLPTDVVCGKTFAADTPAQTKPIAEVKADDMIMDIGPQSVDYMKQIIIKANTILWNGPLGVFEFEAFAHGSYGLVQAIQQSNAYVVAGGGDTTAMIKQFGMEEHISYISTGGGSFLSYLEGKKLPAIKILEEAARAWVAMERGREL